MPETRSGSFEEEKNSTWWSSRPQIGECTENDITVAAVMNGLITAARIWVLQVSNRTY